MDDRIVVFGPIPGCVKCKKALEVSERVAGDLGIKAAKLDIFSEEAEELGILMTPTIVFRGEILSSGKLLTYDALRERVEELMKN